MALDPASIAALSAVAGAALTQIGNNIRARTQRDEKADGVLARVLERRDEDCRRLGEQLDSARVAEQIAVAQAATFGAQLAGAVEDIEQLKRDGEECKQLRADHADLRTRFAELEAFLRGRKITPPYGTEAVRGARDSDDRRVVLPIVSETAGGHRGK